MAHKLSNYLRTYRKRSGLSQAELAFLLGCQSGTKVSRYERHARLPGLETVLAYEVIFQTPARELFAGLYQHVEARTQKRAQLLAEKLADAPPTPAVAYKRASIAEMSSPTRPSHREAPWQGGPEPAARIVALDPTSHGFGFVVFEGPATLVDWGHSHVRPCTHEKCFEQVAVLLARYTPRIVVTEDWESPQSRRRARVRRLLTEVAHFVENAGAQAERISREAIQRTFAPNGSATKDEVAKVIASEFPELALRLPPPRRIWMSEDERTSIFDAAALALTFFRAVEQ